MPGSPEKAGLPAPRPQAFPRAARLKQRRLIRPLFDRRRDDVETVAVGCVRVLFRRVPRTTIKESPIQIGFAPGRTRSAVERNRIRRQLREVYRVHQHLLVDLFAHQPERLIAMILFRGEPGDARACIPIDFPKALRQMRVQFIHARQ